VIDIKSFRRRAVDKLRLLSQGRLHSFEMAVSLIAGKRGLEIGGPSTFFQGKGVSVDRYIFRHPFPIYDQVGYLDNCNFSSKTIWATHDERYFFSPEKQPGKVIISDGSALSTVSDFSYDFVLSSHNLEHFANPIKALKEWQRITCPGGSLILVLPDYRRTFDHRRRPTQISHMLDDYVKDTQENDATHLQEVLELHDLDMDGTLKRHSFEELRERSINNLSNRALHHHVFDEVNSVGLLTESGLEVLSVELALPHHIVILSRWK
jgi:SAM-dependent methyltransferase